MTISLVQALPEAATRVGDVHNSIILPPLAATGPSPPPYREIVQASRMRLFLFQLRKDGAFYWVGAAVPEGTSDFTRLQVYFHPTTQQGHENRAADADYGQFHGGWMHMLRYAGMMGGQLAAARQIPLIVPFMTMAAVEGHAPAYMFATQPRETLAAIATALRDAATPGVTTPVNVARVGVSSFSSGIRAMRLFIRQFGGGGLIVEANDFDGVFIVSEPKILPQAPGAVCRVFSQVAPPTPHAGWTYMAASRFAAIHSFRHEGVHNQIGWMAYFAAMLTTVV